MTVTVVLLPRRAESEADFEAVRLIRNAGRQWMADTREITPEQQAEFQRTLEHPVWVYETLPGEIAGYGLVRRGEDRHAYVSLAVHPAQRGCGIGTAIYRDLRRQWQHDQEVWAVIRTDNTPSIRAALAADYVVTNRIVATGTIALKAQVVA